LLLGGEIICGKGFAGGEWEIGKTSRRFRPKQHQPTLNENSSAVRAQGSARGECAEQGKSAGQQMTHRDEQNNQCIAFGNLPLGRTAFHYAPTSA
jgi:hypothetical protein